MRWAVAVIYLHGNSGNRAVAHGHLGNWAEAAEDARRCIALSEADPKGHFQLARALAMLGDLLPASPLSTPAEMRGTRIRPRTARQRPSGR